MTSPSWTTWRTAAPIAPANHRSHPATGFGPETGFGRNRHPGILRSRHDRSRQGMLAVGFDRCRQGQHVVLVTVQRGNIRHPVIAACQRAGLVEQHGVDLAHALQRQPILDQDPVLRRDRSRNRDH
jgi:hypothetical protein